MWIMQESRYILYSIKCLFCIRRALLKFTISNGSSDIEHIFSLEPSSAHNVMMILLYRQIVRVYVFSRIWTFHILKVSFFKSLHNCTRLGEVVNTAPCRLAPNFKWKFPFCGNFANVFAFAIRGRFEKLAK